MMDAEDGRFAELRFSELLLEVCFKLADQRLSSIGPVIRRSVAEVMAWMLW